MSAHHVADGAPGQGAACALCRDRREMASAWRRAAPALVLALTPVLLALRPGSAADGPVAPDAAVLPGAPVTLAEGLVMLLFLGVAALVVVSILCKLLLAIGWVPSARRSRLRKVIVALAGVAGDVRVGSGGAARSASNGPMEPGGGGSGGAGASGDYR